MTKSYLFTGLVLFFSLATQALPTPLAGPQDVINLLGNGAPHASFMPIIGFGIRARTNGLSQLGWFHSHPGQNYPVAKLSVDLTPYRTLADIDRFFDFTLPGFLSVNVRAVMVLLGKMSPSVEDAFVMRFSRIIADGGYTAANGLQYKTTNHSFFIEVSSTVEIAKYEALIFHTDKALHSLTMGIHDLVFFRLDQFQSIMGVGGSAGTQNQNLTAKSCGPDLFNKPTLGIDDLWKTIVDASTH